MALVILCFVDGCNDVEHFYDVFMRYIFKNGSIAMQEMEWHLFGVIVMLGIAYALKEDSHVRVDVLIRGLLLRQKLL